MRCLTLAQSLSKQGASCEFVCRAHHGHAAQKISGAGFHCHLLPLVEQPQYSSDREYASWLGADWHTDAEQVENYIGDGDTGLLVIDHYGIEANWHLYFRQQGWLIMVIDDLADRHYDCDILLDQTYGREQTEYQPWLDRECKLLLGPVYALLRPEFQQYRSVSLVRRERPTLKKVLITFGGADRNNVTGAVLNALTPDCLPSDCQLTVIMNSQSEFLSDIQSQAKQLPWLVSVKTDVSNMAELMSDSDLCIGAAGSTTWERCTLGLPTIQLAIADNQQQIQKVLAAENIVIAVDSVQLSDSLPVALRSLTNEQLQQVSLNCRKVTDGQGADRVAQTIMQVFGEHGFNLSGYQLIDFIDLSDEQKSTVLRWRNHPMVRQWMFTSSEIPLQDHLQFIDGLKGDSERQYLWVNHQNTAIGVITFNEIDRQSGSAEIGFYVNPEKTDKGRGTALMTAALHYAGRFLRLSKLSLVVMADNQAALGLYKKFGFQEVAGERLKNKKQISQCEQNTLYMQLELKG